MKKKMCRYVLYQYNAIAVLSAKPCASHIRICVAGFGRMIVRDQRSCKSLSPQTPCERIMLSHQEIMRAYVSKVLQEKRDAQKVKSCV